MSPWSIAAALLLGFMNGAPLAAADALTGPDAPAWEVTPPRVSYVSGEASFWRPGSEGWTQAQANLPLAPGDTLAVGADGTVEVQVGPRAFVRAAGGAQLGLETQEPDFLRFSATAGHVALDLRDLPPGHTLTLDTPHATLTVEQPGYYRVSLSPDTTTVAAYRGGRGMVAPATGAPVAVATGQQLILTGAEEPTVATSAAPELSAWDRWNYQRTDTLIAYTSARYVSPDVYGAETLDRYGSWRVVETYGPVWVPTAVPSAWAPYTTGRWLWDPRYGWTWLDEAPWGWAPFHYGRWVFVSGAWGWTPGPVVARPVYAPALVAFLDSPVTVERPVCWVALGWGEPVTPWWGRPGFVGKPWWGGWGGPRVVNNVVVNRTTIVDVEHITVYRNTGVRNAVMAVPSQRFARGPVEKARIAHVEVAGLRPHRGPPPVKPIAASLALPDARRVTPPETAPTPREAAPSQRPAISPGGSPDHEGSREHAVAPPPGAVKRGRAPAWPPPRPSLASGDTPGSAPADADRKAHGHASNPPAGVVTDRPAPEAPPGTERILTTPPRMVKPDHSPAAQQPGPDDAPNAAKRAKVPGPPAVVHRASPWVATPRPAERPIRPPVPPREPVSTRPERPPVSASAREPKVSRHTPPGAPTPVPLVREGKPAGGGPEPAQYMRPPAKPSPASASRGTDVDQERRKAQGPRMPAADPGGNRRSKTDSPSR